MQMHRDSSVLAAVDMACPLSEVVVVEVVVTHREVVDVHLSEDHARTPMVMIWSMIISTITIRIQLR